jgi:hypothetical protein
LLIVELFRRTRAKFDKRLFNLNSFLNDWSENEKDYVQNERAKNYIINDEKVINIKKKKFKFPWWFKIIIYLICLMVSCASVFFIIVQGISFGDEKVEKWITTLLISFLSSIFLTQPIKMVLFTFFCVLLFRSVGDSDSDIDDDGLMTKKRAENSQNNDNRVCLIILNHHFYLHNNFVFIQSMNVKM